MEYCDSDLIKLLLHEPVFHNAGARARCIHGIHCVFLKEVTEALRSLLKVSLLSCLDIVKVDGDKSVPVWPCMLVDKAESMDQLVNGSHEAFIKTATVEGECEAIFTGIKFYLLKLITCSPPILPTSLLHTLTPSRMRT